MMQNDDLYLICDDRSYLTIQGFTPLKFRYSKINTKCQFQSVTTLKMKVELLLAIGIQLS
jgi:hypothetical protein